MPAPSIRAASSMLTGIDSENCFMMKIPPASTMSGMTRHPGARGRGAGALATLARYGISLAFARSTLVPRAVLLVNVAGALLGGAVLGLPDRTVEDGDLRLILIAGIAGGLTTFSTGLVETMEFVLSGRWRMALANVVPKLVLGGGTAVAAYLGVSRVLGTDRYHP